MKTETLAGVRKALIGCLLLAGLLYSAFTVAVSPKPAYASSCNCPEEELEATAYCAAHGGVVAFECPADFQDGPHAFAVCEDVNFTFNEPCSGT
jgi:hypothetical protein